MGRLRRQRTDWCVGAFVDQHGGSPLLEFASGFTMLAGFLLLELAESGVDSASAAFALRHFLRPRLQ
jgi:hypothetical protein